MTETVEQLSCQELVELVTDYLEDALAPEVRERFELHLGARPIRGRARSVWSRDGLHAVRFVSMSDVDRLVIAEHIDRLMRLREELH